jgi:hypothetical protein
MSEQHLFKYRPIDEPLSEIRILSLHPANFDDPITCSISNEPLQSASDYEALSYCWGDPSLSHEISINGSSFAVTESVSYALRYLRQPVTTRRIWVDAVCINQTDVQERTHQVQRMTNIYKQARRVLAWLGPESGGSNEGIELLRFLARKTQEQPNEIPTQPINHLPAAALGSLLDLMLRPYWTRTWITQEVAVPPREPYIGCGHMWDGWQTWRLGLSQVDHYSRLQNTLYEASLSLQWQDLVLRASLVHMFFDLDAVRSSVQADLPTEQKTNIHEILWNTTVKETLDPRDHILAILGLIKAQEGMNPLDFVIPDYSKTVRQVYCEMTKFAMISDQNAEILFFRNHLRNPDLPSWTPDFSTPRDRRLPPNIGHYKRQWRNPTDATPRNTVKALIPRVSDDLEALHVYGRAIGEIHRLLDLTGIHSAPSVTLSRIRSFALPHSSIEAWKSPQLFYFKEALWRTLIANNSGNAVNPCPGSYRNYFDQLITGRVDGSPGTEIFLRTACETISDSETAPHRHLFDMVDGRFGLGPPECEAGDVVCIIYCYSMAVVLRPRAGHFEYIGDCYVYGVMEGEEVPAKDLGEQWTEFIIR